MRKSMFVVCFTLGLALMAYSSATRPRSALAGVPTDTVASDAENASTPRFRTSLQRATLAPATEPPITGGVQVIGAVSADPVEQTPETTEPAPQVADATPEKAPPPEETTAPPTDAATPDDADTEAPWADKLAELDELDETAAPVANAGEDIVVWAREGRTTLSAATSEGEGLTFAWRQISGPPLTVDAPNASETRIGGLDENITSWDPVTYEFVVTVIDANGLEHSDTVAVVAKAAPDIAVVPAADEGNSWHTNTFQRYDSQTLPCFETHIAFPASRPAVFVVDSATPLNFSDVSPGEFDMNYFAEGGRHLYQFELYQTGEESTTQLELFADTGEGIPALIRLGVDW